jgi:membrane protein YdbS with pleckstrin-like domain
LLPTRTIVQSVAVHKTGSKRKPSRAIDHHPQAQQDQPEQTPQPSANSEPSSPPEVEAKTHKPKQSKTIERQRLCQRAVWSFYLSYIGKTSLLFFLFIIGTVFEPLLFGPLLGAYVIILYVSAVIVHQNYYYEVNTSAFRKEHGVIHKTDVTIPFNRIQNVNITRSLSDRILGLARVDIESAGSSSITKRNVAGGSKTKSEGHLPGITLPQAKEVHDLLIEKFGRFQGQPGSGGNP